LTTERLEEAEVSLPLEPGRMLCLEPVREGLGEAEAADGGGTGDRRPARRCAGGSILLIDTNPAEWEEKSRPAAGGDHWTWCLGLLRGGDEEDQHLGYGNVKLRAHQEQKWSGRGLGRKC
jgi:hypothetical protein